MSRYFGDPTAALIAALLTWQAAPTPSSLKTEKSTNSWQNSPWVQVFNDYTVAASVTTAGDGLRSKRHCTSRDMPAQPGAQRGQGQ